MRDYAAARTYGISHAGNNREACCAIKDTGAEKRRIFMSFLYNTEKEFIHIKEISDRVRNFYSFNKIFFHKKFVKELESS